MKYLGGHQRYFKAYLNTLEDHEDHKSEMCLQLKIKINTIFLGTIVLLIIIFSLIQYRNTLIQHDDSILVVFKRKPLETIMEKVKVPFVVALSQSGEYRVIGFTM